MRLASSLILGGALLAAVTPGCSCSGTRPTGHHDSGPSVPGEDAWSSGMDSGDFVRPDAQFVFDDTGPPVDMGCNSMTPVMNEIIGDPPDMLIILDISGSMCEPVNGIGGMTKMAIMKTALETLVSTFDARINFGLMKFPGDRNCGTGVIANPIMDHNASAITTTLEAIPSGMFPCSLQAGGNTPTFLAMAAAQSYFASIPVNPVGRYALLATDGLPNCGAMQSDGSTAPTDDQTVAAVQALHTAGVQTFVLGFGSGFAGAGGAATLNRMAVAGGTGTPYNARSATELTTALNAIAAGIVPASCTIQLEGTARNPLLFQVRFDGGPLIPRDQSHSSGWDYDTGTNTITFYGSECSTVESGTIVSIDVDYGCPGPLI